MKNLKPPKKAGTDNL